MTGQPAGVNDATISRLEIVLGVLLAGTSGAAIIAHVFGPVPMSFTVPFVVLPATAILVSAVLLRRRLYPRFHAFTRVIMVGAKWGFLATLAYDVIRPVLKMILRFSFNPYRAIPIFGQLMTGLPATDPTAIVAGWIYHFWNGISFGVMFAFVRPQGGMAAGVVWAMVLQALMMWVYPQFLQVRLADPGFLMSGLIGHSVWGVVLGAGLRREARHD